MITLAGKTALVTGGSRGIGRAAALLLAQAGADVGITYYSRSDAADGVVKQIQALGRRSFASGGDHGDPAIVEQIFQECEAAFGGLDLFIANHGVWPAEVVPLAGMTVDRWRSTLSANLDGVFLTTRAALRMLRAGGRIVLVSSTAGQRGEAYHADYAATKGALISLTKSLCVECAPEINVNCVAPGWVDTEMSWPAYDAAADARERIAATIPLRRIPPAEDIAGPILFLCSELSRHITGEVLNVNGGSVLCG
jgi:3-oxoacyl-[acyl-carrier protein] reductase